MPLLMHPQSDPHRVSIHTYVIIMYNRPARAMDQTTAHLTMKLQDKQDRSEHAVTCAAGYHELRFSCVAHFRLSNVPQKQAAQLLVLCAADPPLALCACYATELTSDSVHQSSTKPVAFC